MELDELLEDREWTNIKQMCRKHLASIRKLRNYYDSDDVMQNMWLRLLAAYKQVGPKTRGEAFGLVALMIRREVIDLYREKFGVRGDRPVEIPASVSAGSLAEEPLAPLVPDLLTQIVVHDAVEKLAIELKTVVDLQVYCGLTQDEAARVMGCSERQVRRYWQEARVRLMDLLKSQ